ncbi:hypothetical protein ACFLRU_07605, partial [Bacteroidota bacterium]
DFSVNLCMLTVLARISTGRKGAEPFRVRTKPKPFFWFYFSRNKAKSKRIWRLSKYTQNFEKAPKPVLILAVVVYC